MLGGQATGGLPSSQGMQRGMGGPGMGNMGGMHSMGGQLGRAPLAMQGPNSMSSMGMGARSGAPHNFGFDQRGGTGGGGLPGGGAQGSYNPSGDILAMLNKGGGGGHAIGAGGFDGPPSAAFDPSDFPVLGRGGGQGQLGGLEGVDVVGSAALGQQQQKEFSMEEDFPALPGAPGGGQAANNSLMTGGAGAPGMVEQFERMKLENYGDTQGGDAQGLGGPGLAAQPGGQDKYGMLGLLRFVARCSCAALLRAAGLLLLWPAALVCCALPACSCAASCRALLRAACAAHAACPHPVLMCLGARVRRSVIRMNNENLTLLALGCDLTQLGDACGRVCAAWHAVVMQHDWRLLAAMPCARAACPRRDLGWVQTADGARPAGLNLNASGDIYDTFNSPWDRGLQRKNEEYRWRPAAACRVRGVWAGRQGGCRRPRRAPALASCACQLPRNPACRASCLHSAAAPFWRRISLGDAIGKD